MPTQVPQQTEGKGDVYRYQLAVPEEIGEKLQDIGEDSEFADMHYSRRCYHNSPTAEWVLQELIIPAVENGGN
jgi:hypothetical protein